MFKYLKRDLPASIVVFFVALPLCLGIALASGAPLFSGLIAGIIGGIVVGSISGSQVGVSGPAAGLAVIVLGAIASLGSYESFLVAVMIGGFIQILLGIAKAGVIGYYFPTSVIKGMLAGIGIIIFIKQIPFALGLSDKVEFSEYVTDDHIAYNEYFSTMFDNISLGVVFITLISLGIILLWSSVLEKKHKFFKTIPGPVVAVVVGVAFYVLVPESSLFGISVHNLVSVPVPEDTSDFIGQFTLPNFAAITNSEVWIVGITIAIVASLETLLSVEATDKIDPEKRITPTNRELFAQGTGNILSGLIGGIPITQVIVRSTANISSNNKTKLSAILHGFLLLISIILIPHLLNLIPLGVLAAVLFIVGYKLAKPSLFIDMFKLGKSQYVPFLITVVGIVFTDLLIGIGLGLASGLLTVLYNSYKNSHFLHIKNSENDRKQINMTLAEEVTFFNKGAIMRELNNIEDDTILEIDITKTQSLDYDILEILDDYAFKAKNKNIDIKLVHKGGEVRNPESFKQYFGKIR
jgi:MFS superfamily sulfate permease-like transporter